MLSSPPDFPFELLSPLPEGELPWLRSLVARLDHLAGENAELKVQALQQAETIRATVSGCFIGMPTTMASTGPHRAPGRLVCENSA